MTGISTLLLGFVVIPAVFVVPGIILAVVLGRKK